MHHIGRVDWSFTSSPAPTSAASSGLDRSVLVGPNQGAVHSELVVGALAPGGFLARHVHSFEEGLYVLSGELISDLDGHAYRLSAGDFVLHPIGVWHGLANVSDAEVRFLAICTPQRLGPEAGRRDTFFAARGPDAAELAERAIRPQFGDPTLRWVGHYDGTPPQAEALALDDPAHGRRPAGRDTALVVYSGISVKMLIDPVFGADLLTMFTVDYEPGGAAQAHDHPFEETYFFLSGEIEAEVDGEVHTLRAGDVMFAGVGSVHGFYNAGTERVRWIETQAPQPPARHSYRWVSQWTRFDEEEG